MFSKPKYKMDVFKQKLSNPHKNKFQKIKFSIIVLGLELKQILNI